MVVFGAATAPKTLEFPGFEGYMVNLKFSTSVGLPERSEHHTADTAKTTPRLVPGDLVRALDDLLDELRLGRTAMVEPLAHTAWDLAVRLDPVDRVEDRPLEGGGYVRVTHFHDGAVHASEYDKYGNYVTCKRFESAKRSGFCPANELLRPDDPGDRLISDLKAIADHCHAIAHDKASLDTAERLRVLRDRMAHRTRALDGGTAAEQKIAGDGASAQTFVARAKEYIARNGTPRSRKALADALGCSAQALMGDPHLDSLYSRKKAKPPPEAASQRESEAALTNRPAKTSDPLADLVFRESCQRLTASLEPDQRVTFEAKSDSEKRLIVEAWERQQADDAEDNRPQYTRRRSKV